MSDLEDDILDELYFLISYKELISSIGLEDDDMKPVLVKLLRKGWLRCYDEPEKELNNNEIDLEINFRNYYYLASKAGLTAHNNI